MNKNRCHLPPASADTKPAPISSIVKESGLYRPHVTPSLSIGKLLQCSIHRVSILMIFLLPIHQKLRQNGSLGLVTNASLIIFAKNKSKLLKNCQVSKLSDKNTTKVTVQRAHFL